MRKIGRIYRSRVTDEMRKRAIHRRVACRKGLPTELPKDITHIASTSDKPIPIDAVFDEETSVTTGKGNKQTNK